MASFEFDRDALARGINNAMKVRAEELQGVYDRVREAVDGKTVDEVKEFLRAEVRATFGTEITDPELSACAMSADQLGSISTKTTHPWFLSELHATGQRHHVRDHSPGAFRRDWLRARIAGEHDYPHGRIDSNRGQTAARELLIRRVPRQAQERLLPLPPPFCSLVAHVSQPWLDPVLSPARRSRLARPERRRAERAPAMRGSGFSITMLAAALHRVARRRLDGPPGYPATARRHAAAASGRSIWAVAWASPGLAGI